METAERRRAEEKERRLAQARERAAAEKRLREKIAAQTFARSYVSGLVGGVFDQLTSKGFFYDPLAREVEKDFMPWLTDNVVDELQKSAQAMAVVKLLVGEALAALEESRAEAEKRRVREREEEVARLAAEAAEQERIRVDAAAAEAGAAAFFANDPPFVPQEKARAASPSLPPPLPLPLQAKHGQLHYTNTPGYTARILPRPAFVPSRKISHQAHPWLPLRRWMR